MKRINVEKLTKVVKTRVENDLSLHNIRGASLLVAQGGEIVYNQSFGFADSSGREIGGDTMFRLASMTKPVTAAAALMLVDRGLLSLSDTVEKFYPAFENLRVTENKEIREVSGKITIENLLSHTSGIGSGAARANIDRHASAADLASVEAYAQFISRQPLSFIPGTNQEYSPTAAFSILTGIIQRVTGMDYLDFLKRELFSPCEMKDTTFLPTEDEWARLVEMHNRVKGENAVGRTHDGCVFGNVPAQNYLGGAGLVSSLRDYYNFASMLLGGGLFNGRRVLSEEAVRLMRTSVFPSEPGESWGLGVRVVTGEKKAPLPIGSYGWSGAYGTHFWIDPENEIVAIYMKNSCFDGGSHAVTGRNFEFDVYSALE